MLEFNLILTCHVRIRLGAMGVGAWEQKKKGHAISRLLAKGFDFSAVRMLSLGRGVPLTSLCAALRQNKHKRAQRARGGHVVQNNRGLFQHLQKARAPQAFFSFCQSMVEARCCSSCSRAATFSRRVEPHNPVAWAVVQLLPALRGILFFSWTAEYASTL